jgi:hypothetical protein
MDGTMLWFNEEKGYGFILTSESTRVRVERDGFKQGHVPVGRCARLPVKLKVEERDGEQFAVEVTLVPDEEQRRARLRHGGSRTTRV